MEDAVPVWASVSTRPLSTPSGATTRPPAPSAVVGVGILGGAMAGDGGIPGGAPLGDEPRRRRSQSLLAPGSGPASVASAPRRSTNISDGSVFGFSWRSGSSASCSDFGAPTMHIGTTRHLCFCIIHCCSKSSQTSTFSKE